MIVPPILIALFTIYVNAIDRTTRLLGTNGFKIGGLNIGWYGIAGFIALVSGPVLYPVFRSVFGGPSTVAAEAGNDELARAEADILAEAAEAESLA